MTEHDMESLPWSSMTMGDLRRLAREFNVTGRSKLSRDELVRAVREHGEEGSWSTERSGTPGRRSGPSKSGGPQSLDPRSDGSESPMPAQSSSPAPSAEAVFASLMIEPTAPPYLDRGKPIPDTYGEDRLGFMIKTPDKGYAYWELSGPVSERFRLAYGDELFRSGRWVLRIRCITTKQERYEGIELQTYRAHFSLSPGCRHQLQLGFFDTDGVFISVITSRPEETPMDDVSSVVDESRMIESGTLVAMIGGVSSLRNLAPSSLRGIRYMQPDEPHVCEHGVA